jgi:hypothetical protein
MFLRAQTALLFTSDKSVFIKSETDPQNSGIYSLFRIIPLFRQRVLHAL